MRHLALATIAALLLLFAVGCGFSHLGGTNDVAIDYRIDSQSTAEQWVPSVELRLLLAQLPADVEATGDDTLRVTVDADESAFADETLRWRGGVKVYELDPSFPYSPPNQSGIHSKRDGEEFYWVGTPHDLGARVYGAPQPKGHKVFVEVIDNDTARTRVVREEPLVDLSTHVKRAALVEHHRAVEIEPDDAGTAELAKTAAEHPGTRVVVARASTLLAVLPIADAAKPPIVVRYGHDVTSYTYAQALYRLLVSPTLPPMTRTAAAHVPARWRIAAGCVLLPLFLSFAWIFFVRQFDRARPEPRWLVLVTFALGGLAALPVSVVERGLSLATPYLDPRIMTLGGQWIAFPIAIAVFYVSVGLVEEGGKLLGAWALARHRKEFDEPVDGILYACVAALGFAAIENVKYFTDLRLSSSIVASRAFMSVPAHMFFASIWGYGLGRKLVRKKTRVWAWFLLAALAHAAFDCLLSFTGGFWPAMVLHGGLALAFIGMLRASLRHGAVSPDAGDAPASRDRRLFRVGGRLPFLLSSFALVVLAILIIRLGGAWEEVHRQATDLFLLLLTALLSFTGLALWGVTSTVPLDVAIDARGVTFGGAFAAWSAIERIERRDVSPSRAWLNVWTAEGPLHIGPARPATMDVIEQSIAAYRG